MENQENSQTYTLDQETVKVVSDKKAIPNLKRILKSKNMMTATRYLSLFKEAVILAEEKQKELEKSIELETDKKEDPSYLMSFEEAQSKTLGRIMQRENQEKVQEFKEEVKSNLEEELNAIFKKPESFKEQVLDKEVVDSKEGQIENIEEHSPKVWQNPMGEKKETKEEQKNIQKKEDYWNLTNQTYAGLNVPEDTSTSVWIPTGEQTPFIDCGNDVWKSDPIWTEIAFNYDKVIGKVNYEELSIKDSDKKEPQADFLPVYASADQAILLENPINQIESYENFIGSTIGIPYQLVDGKLNSVSNIQNLHKEDSKNLGFPLIRTDIDGNRQIVGFINGDSLVSSLSSNIQKEYQRILH